MTDNLTGVDYKDLVRQALLPRRLEVINQHAKWIRSHEDRALKFVIDGCELNPYNITPYLEECITSQQHHLWRYLRYLGAIPYSEYVGRRQRFLIRDAGHPNHPVMGIAALGSSIMQLRVRDQWIGWHVDTKLSDEEQLQRRQGKLGQQEIRKLQTTRKTLRRELREVKKQRIAAMADLYVSQAIPPYNELTSGKLLCLMMVSNEVRARFQEKYSGRETHISHRQTSDLVLLVTTSVFGRRSSLYNRLKLRDQLAYIPIGETVGFGTAQICDAEFTAMREYLAEHDKEPSHTFGHGSNWRMRVVRAYHELRRKLEPTTQLETTDALMHGFQRGVYIAPLASNAREYLTGATNSISYYDWPLDDIISWWKERWLEGRMNNLDVMKRVRAFRKETIRVSALIAQPESPL